MRKLYVLLAVLVLAGAVSAQVNEPFRGKMADPAQTKVKPGNAIPSNPLKAIIWESDFSDAADWNIGNSAGNTADWVISDAPAFWWSNNSTLASTSGGKAASFNSDGASTAADQIENNAWIVTPSINCSNYTSVGVSVQQYYRKWTGQTLLEVSTNGGSTWTDFEMNASMANNDETSNPSTITVNITSVAAGEPNVKVRFLYLSNAISDGGTDNLAGEAWDYGWIVDDVSIGTLPDNDIAIVKGWHSNIVDDYEYSMMPLSQAKEMVPGVVLRNQGGLTQSFDVTCKILDDGGVVNTTIISHIMAIGTEDTIWFSTGYTPSENGEYEVRFELTPDQGPSNDSFETLPLIMNDYLMAHDYEPTGSYGWNPSGGAADLANAPHSWGNIFYPTVNQSIYGVDINFATGTSSGLTFMVRLQRIDSVNGIQGSLDLINQQLITVNASNIGSIITTVDFPQPSALLAGEGYIIDVFKVDGTQGESFYIGGSDLGSEDEDYSTVAFGPYGVGGAVNYWLAWDFAPYVRANFEGSLTLVSTDSLDGISIYPNPSEGVIKIENANNDVSVIDVFTLDGQKIMSKEIATSTSIDLSESGSGVYLVKVTNENGSIVERVLLK